MNSNQLINKGYSVLSTRSAAALMVYFRRGTWETVEDHTEVGAALRRAAHLRPPVESLYCYIARPVFAAGGEMSTYFDCSFHHVSFATLHYKYLNETGTSLLIVIIFMICSPESSRNFVPPQGSESRKPEEAARQHWTLSIKDKELQNTHLF